MKLVLEALSAFLSWLPLSIALKIGRGMGFVFGSIVRYHRKDAIEALSRSFPEKSEAEIRAICDRMYANLGMNMVESLRLPRATEEYVRRFVRWEGLEHIKKAAAEGKGIIALAAHVGNWELQCSTLALIHPITVIAKDIKNAGVDAFMAKSRARFGLKRVPAHNSYRSCLKALKNNEIVGFVLDQNMIRDEGVFVEFMGLPACTTPGLAYMSAHSGAAVIPFFSLRDKDGHHVMRAFQPVEPTPDRSPESIHEFTQRCTSVIEQFVREHPEQWIWIHRRWRTKPRPGDKVTSSAGHGVCQVAG